MKDFFSRPLGRRLLLRRKERLQAADALRESTERYRLVVENASEAIFVAQDGHITFPNPRLTEWTGFSPEEVTGTPFMEFIHPEDKEMVLERHMMRLKGQDVPDRYAFRIHTKSGETLWVEIAAVLIRWEGRPATLNFLRDITRQKSLEAQLLHAQKMEAVGTLAGGIAHDFNNLLQAISGFADLTLAELPDGDRRRAYVQNIVTSAARASELVRRLLSFSRRARPRLAPLDLNREVEHTVELLKRTIPRMVRIETALAPDLRPVLGDATQIEQVIMNLGANARDAMPDGGRLLVETENAAVSESDGRRPAEAAPGAYVLLRMKDTGKGMDAGTMAKMYDPFFTTKDVGAGTGLGLSAVYGIVRSHGGWVRCDSGPERGTRFEIFLPAFQGPASPVAADAVPLRGAPGGSGKVLIVDDEEMVLDLGKMVLETGGYVVRGARSGEEALDLFRPDATRFDIVVLDMGMPGMGGRKCLEEMRRLNPSVKVLVVSGYPEEQLARGTHFAGAVGFLGKPYALHDLLGAVGRMLKGG